MNKKNTFKVLTGTLTAAALVVGAVSFTAITAIADETVDYYGISADGTVISGTVTDYTKITSADIEWGVEGMETWYVADGNITVGSYDFPVVTWGKVNIIVKDDAGVIVDGGIKNNGSEVTVYSESKDGNGVIAFIGKQGQNGGSGITYSGEEASHGKNGYNGYPAVDIAKLTVAGGTVTAIGGKGGNGGEAGYGANWVDGVEVFYYGKGGNGGDGAYAVTENTEIYLNGGTLNATAGRGGIEGKNTHVPSAEQENYRGAPGNSAAAAVKGIHAVNGILNVNKLDDSDENDTTGDYELLSADGYENAKLTLAGQGTAKVNDGTVIKTYGDISVAGTLSVDNGTILTNGSITKADNAAQITKTNGGIIHRFTPAYGDGYTLDYAGGMCIAETGYKIKLSDGNTLTDVADAYTIVSESNRLNIVRIGDGEIIDDSEPCTNVMPYCIKANNTNETTVTDGNVFAVAGDSSRFTFALNDPDEYRFSGVTVTDIDGNAIPDNMYTFDSTTGEFIALSVDRNLIVTADASLKDVEISVTDSENNPVSAFDIGTDFDNGNPTKTVSLKVKVTEGGSIAKYRVVKESDLNKASGAITDTSSFTVSYTAGDDWGTADDGSSKLAKGATATFTVKPDSNLAAGTYTEDFIVITDRTAYADASAGTQDKALARFTLTYMVEHESDGKLYYSDLTGHYNLCKNCPAKINKENHTFDVKTVNEDTLALPADCVNPAKYFYSCECGAHTDDTTLVFESGAPSGHKFGEWKESKSANCEEGGKEKHICSVCKAEEERDTAPLGHDWNAEYTIDVKPTCTKPGSKSIHCSRCDATKDVTEIEPLGHDWEADYTTDVKPTCTQPGSKSIHCSRCDATKDVTEIEPTGHSFGEWTVSKDSTCVAGGQKTRKCETCGYTEYEDTDIDSDAHEWEEDYTIDKEPTCTTEGSKSIHCSRCDATKDSTVIPVTEHTYGEWEIVTPSTCTENGVKKHACIRCGFEQTGIINAAHDWENTRTIDILPSCTEYGEDSIHCRNCDARTDIEELSPEGHDWSEWETLVEPTKTSEGKAYRFCYTCGIKEEKTLDKLTDETDWQYDDKKHWHKDNDGNIIDLDDHEFKWVVDKEPTATEPGIGHYECISCAFEQAPEEFGKRNPETGSESLVLWGATALIAGTTATITLRMRKKKNK